MANRGYDVVVDVDQEVIPEPSNVSQRYGSQLTPSRET
jgi:hypothetical protein